MLFAVLSCGLARGAAFDLAVDVPTKLGAATYLANQIAHYSGASGYSLGWTGGLPAEAHIDGLARLPGGAFLFSVDAPVTIAGTTYQPADVIQFAGTYSLYMSGAALGLPAAANADAIALDSSGHLLLSFDTPLTVGGTTYQPADIARVTGASLSMWLDASTIGIPDSVNVTGFETTDAGDDLFLFDAPTVLGGTTFLPGDIARYRGGTFDLFFHDPSFPPASASTDFALPASPGAVPDGTLVPGVPLTLQKISGNADIQLDWGGSCSPDASDYEVYEGSLGSWYSHTDVLCSTGGARTARITPRSSSRYFLVVPANEQFEGSYGSGANGAERPRGARTCIADQKIRSCS